MLANRRRIYFPNRRFALWHARQWGPREVFRNEDASEPLSSRRKVRPFTRSLYFSNLVCHQFAT